MMNSRRTLVLLWAMLLTAASGAAHGFDTVVIDAGHGGIDSGCGWNGLVEKTLCLDVAKRLDEVLKAKGMKTVMTRSTDEYVELAERTRIANLHANAIFVSVHFNANRTTSIRGFQTHFRSPVAKTLAESIQGGITRRIGPSKRAADWEDFKVLRETKCTAVLVECGFISNKAEAANCGSTDHRQKLAEGIADGITQWKAP